MRRIETALTASVSDGELGPAASVGDPARLQLDLTLFGELAGIAQQIEQYLPQPHGVHGEDTQVLLGVDKETVLVLLGKLSGGADDLHGPDFTLGVPLAHGDDPGRVGTNLD